jgi:hypothetical protein
LALPVIREDFGVFIRRGSFNLLLVMLSPKEQVKNELWCVI